jgi:YVTN family beta-propeller protein
MKTVMCSPRRQCSNLGEVTQTRGLLMRVIGPALVLALLTGVFALRAADQTTLQKVYVTNSSGDNITVIDLKTMKVTGDIKVGKKPHGAATQADGRRFFTTVESERVLKIIDTSTDKIIDTIALTGTPNQCAVTPDGKFAAVPIRDGNTVDIINVDQKKVVKVLPDNVPHNCYNAGSNHHMFCTSMGDQNVHLIDLEKMSSVEIPVGGIPRPIAVTKDEKTLFAALTELHGFVIVDASSKSAIHKVEFPPVANPNPNKADTPTHGMNISPNGKELWVAGVWDDGVYVYNIASKELSKKIPTGKTPNWVAFSPDGKYVAVTNEDSDDCSIIDTSTYQEVARVKVGRVPKRLVVVYAQGS